MGLRHRTARFASSPAGTRRSSLSMNSSSAVLGKTRENLLPRGALVIGIPGSLPGGPEGYEPRPDRPGIYRRTGNAAYLPKMSRTPAAAESRESTVPLPEKLM